MYIRYWNPDQTYELMTAGLTQEARELRIPVRYVSVESKNN
jgi:hypothetical protein